MSRVSRVFVSIKDIDGVVVAYCIGIALCLCVMGWYYYVMAVILGLGVWTLMFGV